jgi:hypothetical protein
MWFFFFAVRDYILCAHVEAQTGLDFVKVGVDDLDRRSCRRFPCASGF